MKQTLLLTLAAAALATTGAAQHKASVENAERASAAKSGLLHHAARKAAKPASEFQLKTLNSAQAANKTLRPDLRRTQRRTDGNGVLLQESFESPEGLTNGWTSVSYGDPGLENSEHWNVMNYFTPWIPAPTDGDYYMMLMYSSLSQDEWIISPEVQMPAEGQYNLTYDAYIDPIWHYDTTLIDFETGQWIDQVIINTFQVLVSADGGEYEVVRDYAEEYMGADVNDLIMMQAQPLMPQTVDLSAYAGKSIRVAFRFVGADGQMMLLDNVKIALPPLEAVMGIPYSTLYWGYNCQPDMSYFTTAMAQYPVYQPLTFWCDNWTPGVSYSWSYCDPDTFEMVDAEGDELTVAYHTDYTDDFSTRNNLYYTPVLRAHGDGASDAETTMDCKFLQAGGEASWVFEDGEFTFGLLPYSPVVSGSGLYTIDSEKIGDPSIPVFGYNPNTDAYWTDYTFDGDQEEGDASYVTNYFNYIYPAEGPMVFSKVWANAYGKLADSVELTAEIVPLVDVYDDDGDWMGQMLADEPMAAATITGADVLKLEQGSGSTYLTLPFDFGQDVVIDDTHSAYIVRISGFHNPEVGYFCPFQQWVPSTNGIALGWYSRVMIWQGVERTTMSPIAYRENEYGPMFCAFAINLGAEFPWLHSDVQALDLGDSLTGSVALDSYYDGAELTVEAPEWVTSAVVTGRYGETRLEVTTDQGSGLRQGSVTVKGAGVELTLALSQDFGTGVKDLAADSRQVKEVRNLQGILVDAAALPAGVYLVTYTDGTTAKRLVR